MSAAPDVPSPGKLDPLMEEIPAGTDLVRVYDRRWGPLDFNPTSSSARLRPIHDRQGAVVPSAYVAARTSRRRWPEAVLRSVTALRTHPGPGRPRLYALQVDPLDLCVVRLTSPVRVARLHGAGLTRLGLLREHVIDTDEADYPYTARWAQTIWGSRPRPHGIAWTSRQNDSGRAYVLWAGRIKPGATTAPRHAIRLDREPGRDLVRQACVAARVDFEGLSRTLRARRPARARVGQRREPRFELLAP